MMKGLTALSVSLAMFAFSPNRFAYFHYLIRGMALLHKDLKVKTSHIYSNLSDNSGMWSA
ncbi:hypothetical protein B9X93_04755 [Acinetobacter baumannii]|nr:hypothetical protein B9X93_04755 [Acinetobacter baumannii]